MVNKIKSIKELCEEIVKTNEDGITEIRFDEPFANSKNPVSRVTDNLRNLLPASYSTGYTQSNRIKNFDNLPVFSINYESVINKIIEKIRELNVLVISFKPDIVYIKSGETVKLIGETYEDNFIITILNSILLYRNTSNLLRVHILSKPETFKPEFELVPDSVDTMFLPKFEIPYNELFTKLRDSGAIIISEDIPDSDLYSKINESQPYTLNRLGRKSATNLRKLVTEEDRIKSDNYSKAAKLRWRRHRPKIENGQKLFHQSLRGQSLHQLIGQLNKGN